MRELALDEDGLAGLDVDTDPDDELGVAVDALLVGGRVGHAPDVIRDPIDLPAALGSRPPQIVRVDLETVELKGQLDNKTTYNFWTFNGNVEIGR